MYIDGEYAHSADFYHGKDRFHISKGVAPEHNGANALVIYTLSPETTSTFKNIQVCMHRCLGGDKFISVSTNDHYEEDPNDLLRRRLEQNSANILNYKYMSVVASSLLLLNYI